jgi:SAM-dependent methyltransferase
VTTGFYVCPEDRKPLRAERAGLRCTRCNRAFGMRENVLDLDVIKSSERQAFDALFRAQTLLSPEQIDASARLAAHFLRGVGRIKNKKILDMACGNGAITHGLLISPEVVNSDVFCFDHSVESMRVFLNSASQLQTSNRLHPSLQDVHRSAYPDDFFDVIFGNAILHHFLRYEDVLAQVHRNLKKGGIGIFAEPFAYGYFWAAHLMQMAGASAPSDAAGRGLLEFMVQNTFDRLNFAADRERLALLTDKHFFFDDELTNLCTDLGFKIHFAPYEQKEYYAGFMEDMLRTYDITHPQIAARARSLYAVLHGEIPNAAHHVVAHFKFILLQK